jgi:hypothetical protein
MICWNGKRPGVPPTLNAGDTWQFTASYPQYPASAGWAASLLLVSPSVTKSFSATTDPNGSDFDFLILPAVTVTIAPGPYSYRVVVVGSGSLAGSQFTAEQSRITVGQAFTSAYDGASIAEQQLAACNATIQALLSSQVQSATFGNQTYTATNLGELWKIRQELITIIKNEADALRIAQGLNSGRQIHVRFTN